MFTLRKILYLMGSLVLAACSALPASAPEAPDSAKVETPAPKPEPAQPSTLADSVPVAVWKGNSQGHLLTPIDPASGQALPDYEPIPLGQALFHAFSPDQSTLAAIGFVSSEHPRGGSLHLIDLGTWEDDVQELQLDGYVNAMSFSPDGKQLGIAYGSSKSQVLIFELDKPFIKSKSAVRQASLDLLAYNMKFTADGSGLMVYGSKIENRYTVSEMSPDPPVVVLLDSSDLSVRWNADLPGIRHGVVPKDEKSDETADLHQPGQAIYLFPGLVFAPARDILYVVHPDEDKLTTVDFAAQEVDTVEIQPKLSWFERLLSLTAGVAHAKIAEGTSKRAVISPDGQFLYIVGQQNDLIQDKHGNWQVIENPLGLQIVRVDDGSRLTYIDTEASELSISPDGRYLYLRGWGEAQDGAWTQVFDPSTNQFLDRMDGVWLVPTRRIDGAPVLASSVWLDSEHRHLNAVVDPKGLSALAEWSSSEYLAWLAMP